MFVLKNMLAHLKLSAGDLSLRHLSSSVTTLLPAAIPEYLPFKMARSQLHSIKRHSMFVVG